MKLNKNFIPLRDKIEAGAHLVRTITSCNILIINSTHESDYYKARGLARDGPFKLGRLLPGISDHVIMLLRIHAQFQMFKWPSACI